MEGKLFFLVIEINGFEAGLAFIKLDINKGEKIPVQQNLSGINKIG